MLFENYQNKKYNKYFASMVMNPAPLNCIIVPFLPFMFTFKSEKINDLCMQLGFQLFLTAYFLIYIVANLVFLIPLCYFKYSFSLMINLLYRRLNFSSLSYFFYWIFSGIFYLLYIFVSNDLFHFNKSIF